MLTVFLHHGLFTVAAKLRYLKRGLNHLEMNTANMIAAECTNILNTLKYFNQILLKYCAEHVSFVNIYDISDKSRNLFFSVQVERANNVGLLSWPPGSCRGRNNSLTNHRKYDQDNKWTQYVASYPIFDYITLHNTVHALLLHLPSSNERKGDLSLTIFLLPHLRWNLFYCFFLQGFAWNCSIACA